MIADPYWPAQIAEALAAAGYDEEAGTIAERAEAETLSMTSHDPWMLRQLAALVQGLAVTTQSKAMQPEGTQLPLAEAFITATGKPEPLAAS